MDGAGQVTLVEASVEVIRGVHHIDEEDVNGSDDGLLSAVESHRDRLEGIEKVVQDDDALVHNEVNAGLDTEYPPIPVAHDPMTLATYVRRRLNPNQLVTQSFQMRLSLFPSIPRINWNHLFDPKCESRDDKKGPLITRSISGEDELVDLGIVTNKLALRLLGFGGSC